MLARVDTSTTRMDSDRAKKPDTPVDDHDSEVARWKGAALTQPKVGLR